MNTNKEVYVNTPIFKIINRHLSILKLMEENKTAFPKIKQKKKDSLELMTKEKRNK